MARVQKDVVSYFPHDASACTGDTLTVLQGQFGNDGYAFWFKLLEKLSLTEGHCLDCSNSNKWQLLLAKTGVNEITGVEIMKLLVEMKAIDKELWESKLIWCQKLVDNVSDVYKNRRREIPLKPVITDKKRIITEKNTITTGQSTQSKVEYIKVDKIIIPEWIDKDTWEDFLEMRKKNRSIPTDKAKVLLIKELNRLKGEGHNPNEVLNQSIMNNYKGVFPLKGGQGGTHQRNTGAEKTTDEDRRRGLA